MLGRVSRLALAVTFSLSIWQVSDAKAEPAIIYDFEDGPSGWEHESKQPSKPITTGERVVHGKRALGFGFHFGPDDKVLQVRVMAGHDTPWDFDAKYGDFVSISAWVFIPSHDDWRVQMFVRSSSEWEWRTGPSYDGLEAGWHRVEIEREDIYAPAHIQDIGIQVWNETYDLETTILIDKIEVLTNPADTSTETE